MLRTKPECAPLLGPVIVQGHPLNAQGRSGVADSYNPDTERYAVKMLDGAKVMIQLCFSFDL